MGLANIKGTKVMREVSQFVVVFPGRFLGQGKEDTKLLLDAMRREYPHYDFESAAGHALSDDFQVIPIVGRVGAGEGDDPDRIYMCKPLDPRVIPDLVETLKVYAALGATVN